MRNLWYMVVLIGIFCLAWQFQEMLFLSWDVSYMLEAAKKMLAHGTYTHDFFNPNPPIIFYLYAPVVLAYPKLAAYLTIAQLFHLYIFVLTALSLLLCHFLAKKEIIALMAAALLFLPLYELGQREYLVIIFILPYLFLLANRLEKNKVNLLLVILTGLFAGIGFAIKPHYLLIFVLVETFYVFKTRQKLCFLRPETCLIGLVVGGHLLLIKYFFPDYFTTIMPYLLRLYMPAIASRWTNLLLTSFAGIFYFTAGIYFLSHDVVKSKSIYSILFIVLVGFFITYLVQGTFYYYHLLPCIFFAIMIVYLTLRENLQLFIGMLSLCVLINVGVVVHAYYKFARTYQHERQSLVAFLTKYTSKQPVAFYIAHVSVPFPSVSEANAILGQHLDCHWPAAGLMNTMNSSAQWQKDKDFYMAMINEDLRKYKPQYVFIDKRDIKPYFNHHFDYLQFFLRDAEFKKNWQDYKFMTAISYPAFYEFDVYKRIKNDR